MKNVVLSLIKQQRGIITALEIVIVSENAGMTSLWNMVFLKREGGQHIILEVKQNDCNINSMIYTELDHQAFQ